MKIKQQLPQIDLNRSDDPFFFFHIPKTAGSTLVDILESYFSYPEICPAYYTYELNNFRPEQLHSYRLFQGHIDYHVLCKYLGKKPQTITFLRDPVDHAISIFSHLKRKSNEEFLGNEVQAIRQMSLEKFIFEPDRIINLDYSNLQLRTLIANSEIDLWTSRSPAINGFEAVEIPSNQAVLTYGKQLLSEFFFVGLSERFEDSLFLLAYIFGVRPLEIVPYINVSPNKPSKKDFEPLILEQINWKNQLDFELYKFAQQLFDERFAIMTCELIECYATEAEREAYSEGPLPREVLYNLLEKHYFSRFTRRHPPVSSVYFDANQQLNGRRWHKREEFARNGICRWTGPGKVSTIDFPLAAEGDLKISFEVAMALFEENLDTIELYIEGDRVPLTHRVVDNYGRRLYEGILPQPCLAAGQGLVRLKFEVAKPLAIKKFDPNSPDDREVGVIIRWIEIAPVSESETAEAATA